MTNPIAKIKAKQTVVSFQHALPGLINATGRHARVCLVFLCRGYFHFPQLLTCGLLTSVQQSENVFKMEIPSSSTIRTAVCCHLPNLKVFVLDFCI